MYVSLFEKNREIFVTYGARHKMHLEKIDSWVRRIFSGLWFTAYYLRSHSNQKEALSNCYLVIIFYSFESFSRQH